MFENPFSFKGRIRRAEYCISFFANQFALVITQMLYDMYRFNVWLLLVSYIPLFWFFAAQGVKRCHDRNNSGWYQLIPYYVFWMAFAAGDPGDNKYGPSPKQHGSSLCNS